jgi:nitronate monooxygenase
MTAWPDRRLLDLLGIELPIIQAPMAGATTAAMTVAVAEAGGVGSLASAMLSPDQARVQFRSIRQQTSKPINMNFFCHAPAIADAVRAAAWRRRLKSYHIEFGLDPEMPSPALNIIPFGGAHCDLVEELKPEIVSFHFGLPSEELLDRVKATGAKILSSATTVEEAVWLEQKGCDAIIAQGLEAGGHRGMFLSDNIVTQVGTMALVPQLFDAVHVPIIAAGGIADGRGIAAAFALGAAGAQIGTAYLFCPEANVAPLHRQALKTARDDQTAVTNVLTGRPARDRQPGYSRSRPDGRRRTCFSARGGRSRGAARQVGGIRFERLHTFMVRSGRRSRARASSRGTDCPASRGNIGNNRSMALGAE